MASTSLDLFTYSLEKYEGGVFCVYQWEETFGEAISFTVIAHYVAFLYTPVILLTLIYSITLIKLKLQEIPGQESLLLKHNARNETQTR